MPDCTNCLVDVKLRQHESGTFPTADMARLLASQGRRPRKGLIGTAKNLARDQLHNSFADGNSEQGGVDAALLPAGLLDPDKLPAPEAPLEPDTLLDPVALLVP
jgi:hypothetical protein